MLHVYLHAVYITLSFFIVFVLLFRFSGAVKEIKRREEFLVLSHAACEGGQAEVVALLLAPWASDQHLPLRISKNASSQHDVCSLLRSHVNKLLHKTDQQ